MKNKTLFEQAIADAKNVRETALANAKAALDEELTPRIQSMVAAKLNEMEDELNETQGSLENLKPGVKVRPNGAQPNDGRDMTIDSVEDGRANCTDTKGNKFTYRVEDLVLVENIHETEGLEEDLDISAILAELDAEENVDEAKKDDEPKEDDEDEPKDDETSEEEIEVKDMTVDELKDLIKDIVSQEIGSEEETPEEDGIEGLEDMGSEISSDDGNGEVNLDELLAELDALDNDELEEAKKEDDKEMKEALDTIAILRKEINEVNLMNAKLLYVNRIFKSKNLNESQKVHVIASFDKATTTKEAKIVYESLNTALTATKKPIKESLGFASKAVGMAPNKQPIIEADDVVSRWKKLANIK